MPINKPLLKKILSTKSNMQCSNTPDAVSELAATLSDTEALVESCQNVQAVPFILWNDFYNQSGILSPKSKKQAYRYKWGDKVFVDFGCGNIQTELSFPHPAIVLYNFANSVIVVPTTSDDSPASFSSDIEEAIIKVQKDGIIFPKDTIINLHQLKAVHKDRIIANLRCNVKSYMLDASEIARQNAIHGANAFINGMDLLAAIRTKIMYLLAEPQIVAKDNLIKQQYDKITELQIDLVDAAQRISELESQLERITKDQQSQGK